MSPANAGDGSNSSATVSPFEAPKRSGGRASAQRRHCNIYKRAVPARVSRAAPDTCTAPNYSTPRLCRNECNAMRTSGAKRRTSRQIWPNSRACTSAGGAEPCRKSAILPRGVLGCAKPHRVRTALSRGLAFNSIPHSAAPNRIESGPRCRRMAASKADPVMLARRRVLPQLGGEQLPTRPLYDHRVKLGRVRVPAPKPPFPLHPA